MFIEFVNFAGLFNIFAILLKILSLNYIISKEDETAGRKVQRTLPVGNRLVKINYLLFIAKIRPLARTDFCLAESRTLRVSNAEKGTQYLFLIILQVCTIISHWFESLAL